jgi:hypothetical protein
VRVEDGQLERKIEKVNEGHCIHVWKYHHETLHFAQLIYNNKSFSKINIIYS